MTSKERVELFEDDGRILKALAEQYSEDSREYEALKHASIALWYVLTEGHERFAAYVKKFEGPLTDEQRAHLRQMGIDPDADVDDT